ncbi:anti-sigma factor family protein [Nisaea sp.]|uniref:anti-sigma factor family protein n=1 Tax=Nisaea sp. TaxID=2024842 RepID=UPI003B51E8D9
MKKQTDTPSDIESDLLALLQGRLDAERAYLVADHLADNPERAAQVLSDARDIEGLRLALSEPDTPPPAPIVTAARRLEERLQGRHALRRFAPIAASLFIFAAGWATNLALQNFGTANAHPLVDAALDAQAALDLRHWMVSQPESTELNTAEIVGALGIQLPALPAGWTVRDVQVVSSPERPGIAIDLDTQQFGRVLLFAIARDVNGNDTSLTAFDYQGRSVALFTSGHSAYVLVDASGHPEQITVGAKELLSRIN